MSTATLSPTFIDPGPSSGTMAECIANWRACEAVERQPLVGYAIVRTIDVDGSRMTGGDTPEPEVIGFAESYTEALDARPALTFGREWFRVVECHGERAEFVL